MFLAADGESGKRFGNETVRVTDTLVSVAAEQDIAVIAVDPAYTNRWGAQHGQQPLPRRRAQLPGRPTTTAAIVVSIGPPRPDRAPAGARKPAPASPDHGHAPCTGRGAKAGDRDIQHCSAVPAVTGHGPKTHSCPVIRNGRNRPLGARRVRGHVRRANSRRRPTGRRAKDPPRSHPDVRHFRARGRPSAVAPGRQP